MKKEVKLLLAKSIDSLTLSIEHFNRPWDTGRREAVLILMDHAFELLLKSAIRHRGGRIKKRTENQTIGFDECLKNAIPRKIISEDQARSIRVINSLRDAAQHYLVIISEQHLYIHMQTGMSIFQAILQTIFEKNLTSNLPQRVLPLSTTPLLDVSALFTHEIDEVKKLLLPNSRKKIEVMAKLRALAIFETSIKGGTLQPSDEHLKGLANSIKEGKNWEEIFPTLSSINFVLDDTGPSLCLKITKNEGIPVRLVPENTPNVPIIGVKRVSELDFYNLSVTGLAKHLNLGTNKTVAIIKHFELQKNPVYYKEIKIGKSSFKRYSQNALEKIKTELPKNSLEEIWQKNRSRKKSDQLTGVQ